MHAYLFDELHKRHVQQPNQLLLNGIADYQSEDIMEIVRKKYLSYSRHWPEWFKYVDIKVCSPEETVMHMMNRSKGPMPLELNESSVFMVELHLQLENETLIKPHWLPYVKDHTFKLAGTRYQMGMVLTDEFFSVDKEKNKLFLKTDLDNITFQRFSYAYQLDDIIVNDSVPFGQFYKNKGVKTERKQRERAQYVEIESCLVHYLCARYGLKDAIEQYIGVEVSIGDSTTILGGDYPPDEYVVAKSSFVKPRAFSKAFSSHWVENDLRIAFRREDDSRTLRRFLAGVFYVTDHHPKRVNALSANDPGAWCTALGYIHFTYMLSEMERQVNISKHMQVMEMYLDVAKQDNINESGIFGRKVSDFFDLLMCVVEYMPEIIRQARPGNMLGKRVKTIEYLLDDYFNEIGALTLSCSSSNERNGQGVSKSALKQQINAKLHPDVWVRALKSKLGVRHGEIRGLDSTTSCKAVKITTAMISQEDVSGSKKNKDITKKEQYYADESVITVGSTMQQPKHQPDGRAFINSHVKMNVIGRIKVASYLEPLHTYCRATLK